MNVRPINSETLNAYVDGELDAKVAADVARAIADNRALAREVAALSRLRVTVAEAFSDTKFDLPEQQQPRSRRMAIAACICCVMLVAGAILIARPDSSGASIWLSRAWELHDGWSIDESLSPTARDVAHNAGALLDAYVPDLSASRLTLVQAKVFSITKDSQALLAGYRGSRGCKISLFIFSSPANLEKRPESFRNGTREGYGWRTAHVGYLVLSDGMDSERFRLLANSIHRVSRQRLPFDTKTRMALRISRDESRPCLA